MTPGMKTSEFVFAAAQAVLGIVLAILGVLKGNEPMMTWGLTILGVGGGTFALARGLAKVGSAAAAPQPPPAPAPEPVPVDAAAAAAIIAGKQG